MTCTLQVLANIAPKAKEKDTDIVTAFIWNKMLWIESSKKTLTKDCFSKELIHNVFKSGYHAHVTQFVVWHKKTIHSKCYYC